MHNDFYTVIGKYKGETFLELARASAIFSAGTVKERAIMDAKLRILKREAPSPTVGVFEIVAVVKGSVHPLELDESDTTRNVKDYTVFLRNKYGNLQTEVSGRNIKEAIIASLKDLGFRAFEKLKELPLLELIDWLIRNWGLTVVTAVTGKKLHRVQ